MACGGALHSGEYTKMRFAHRAACGVSALAIVSALGSGKAFAQAIPGSLPSRAQVELPPAPPPKPQAEVSVNDRSARVATCPFADSTIEVSLDRVRFSLPDGAAPPAALLSTLAAIAPAHGPHRLVQLCDLRDAAADALRRAGYIAGVTIPPQEINSGEALLYVIPGRLRDVHVTGSAGPNQRTLDARIAQLKAMPILNTHEIERILLLAGDVPGLRVALTLRSADAGPGELIGELAVSFTPFVIVANAQNSGSRSIGRESLALRAEYYGLTGHGDRTFIGGSSTADFKEQQVVQVGQYFGTDHGATFGGSFSYAWSRPDIGGLDLRSRSLIGGIDGTVPLIRTVRANLSAGGGFELIEQRIKLNFPGAGAIPVTEDKLRIGYLRLSGSLRHPQYSGPDRWSLAASLELRQGLDVFGTTKAGTITPAGYAPSRFDGNPEATVIRGGLDGTVAFGRIFSIGATLQGQWASGALLSFEEFSVGNLTIGRGYDPGVTSGDKAIAARIEPRADLPLSHVVGTQVFGFYDTVRIWNDDLGTTENDRPLSSWGGGLRAYLPGRLSLEAMYAHPQDQELRLPGAPRASDRVLLSLTVQFAPRR